MASVVVERSHGSPPSAAARTGSSRSGRAEDRRPTARARRRAAVHRARIRDPADVGRWGRPRGRHGLAPRRPRLPSVDRTSASAFGNSNENGLHYKRVRGTHQEKICGIGKNRTNRPGEADCRGSAAERDVSRSRCGWPSAEWTNCRSNVRCLTLSPTRFRRYGRHVRGTMPTGWLCNNIVFTRIIDVV